MSAATSAKMLREATAPQMVEVSPCRWIPRDGAAMPDVVLCRMVRGADGAYVPKPFAEKLVKVDAGLLKMLGLSYPTMRRLGFAGFIEVIKPSPSRMLINLDSYYNHLARVAEDPEFWDRPENLKAYAQAREIYG